MRLTRFTDYSLRVLIYVAARPAGTATIDGIASAFGISRHHLTKVVHRLGREGLLATSRGKGGGVRLAAPAASINVGSVVRLMECPDVTVECFDPATNVCAITSACRLRGALEQALTAFYSVLEKFTLEDLVRNREGLAKILFFPRPGRQPAASRGPAITTGRKRA